MAIADTIQSMTENLESSYDVTALSEIDMTGVNKNLQNLPDTIKRSYLDIMNNGYGKVWDNWEKVTGEGTSLTLNNTEQAPIKMELKGNTSQTGTPTPSSPIPVNVVSGDNEISVCGKNLFDQDYYLTQTFISGVYYYAPTKLQTGTVMYLSSKVKEGKTAISGLYVCLTTNGNNPNTGQSAFYIQNGTERNNISYNPSVDSAIYLSYYPKTYTWQQILEVYDFWVSYEGNTTYEPYQSGKYSINLPVENLLDIDTINYKPDNYTITKANNNYTYTVSSSGTWWQVPNYKVLNIEPNTKYTYSFNVSGLSITSGKNSRILIDPIDSNGAVISISGTNHYIDANSIGTYSKTFTTPANTRGFLVRVYVEYSSSTANTYVTLNSFMIEKGSKANSYTSYGTTPIKLCKIGNYQDYFYKDSGKWYLHKEIGKIASYNGETITTSYISTTGGLDTGATVYYVLATPTTTQITDTTLISQLNALELATSKENQTNISQVNNDLPFIISASALKEWSV